MQVSEMLQTYTTDLGGVDRAGPGHLYRGVFRMCSGLYRLRGRVSE